MGSHIVEGALYEIDHFHLPTRTPSQLRSVRVAMVCEKTSLNIGLRFPSMASLSEFFNCSKTQRHPDFDVKFVMGKALAARVLVKIVPKDIFAQQKCLESFWLIRSMAAEMCKDNGADEEKKGACFSELKGNGMATWGYTRQMKFLGRPQENECSDGNGQNSSSNFVYGVAGFRGVKSEERDSLGGKSEEGIDDDQEIDDEEEENKAKKRKRYPLRNRGVKKTKLEIRAVKKEKVEKNGRKRIIQGRTRCREAQIPRDPKSRWSPERYKLAEKNLLGVFQLKGATAEKPILRPQLRDEARKQIDDVGLLDYLIKRMDGMLAPGGKERFRRRHNPDGAMEYWLEKADLMSDAGVPPPGWKPGDSPNQDHLICATELKLLKDEFCKMKREMGLMATKMQMDEEVGKLRRKLEEINSKRKQEEYQAITTKSPSSNVISQKLDELAASLVGDSPVSMGGMGASTEKTLPDSKPLGAAEERAAKIQRLKNDFRICKSQDTFLWPNMVKDNTSMSSQVVIQVEVPTPPSVSSSSGSNAPQRICHHSHNTPALAKPFTASIDLNDAPNES